MTSDDGIRASDADRENAVAILRDAYVSGRLTLPEFDERTSAAFTSRTWGELRTLTADLPARPALGAAARLPAAPPPPADRETLSGAPRWAMDRPDARRLLTALQIAAVWLVISVSARSAAAYIPLMVLLLIGLRLAAGRGHHHGGGSRGGGRPGQRHPDRPR